MGATGYLFKNDSTSPKIHFLNFRALVFTAFFLRRRRVCCVVKSEQMKTGRPEGLPAV
jgi:hypothetical protein